MGEPLAKIPNDEDFLSSERRRFRPGVVFKDQLELADLPAIDSAEKIAEDKRQQRETKVGGATVQFELE